MKTVYKIDNTTIHVPDEWECSYKNGVYKFTEIYHDGDEILENGKTVVDDIMYLRKTIILLGLKSSKYRNRLTVKSKIDPINAIGMLLGEMMRQYALRGGDVKKDVDTFFELFKHAKKDEMGVIE